MATQQRQAACSRTELDSARPNRNGHSIGGATRHRHDRWYVITRLTAGRNRGIDLIQPGVSWRDAGKADRAAIPPIFTVGVRTVLYSGFPSFGASGPMGSG